MEDIDVKPSLPSPLSSPHSPLREVSPEKAGGPILKSEFQRKPSEPRFPARTVHGERQCTNCGEVDTPQWRGTLCNACALWKRSRGTDRPLPLLFTTRKRPRSPTPYDDDDDDDEEGNHAIGPDEGQGWMSGSHSPLCYTSAISPGNHCSLCGNNRVVATRSGRAFCGPCTDTIRLAQRNEVCPHHPLPNSPSLSSSSSPSPHSLPLLP